MDFESDTGKIDLSNLESQESIISVSFEDQRETPFSKQNSGDRLEQTVAGLVIGSVRDLVSEPETLNEKAERAASNDFMAEIAADVMVMLPRFRMAKAGIARTALLANPQEGFNQSASSLAGNFLEGAALNKVSRSLLPGSKLQGLTARHLGKGLTAEAATHLSAGFGFGAVKAGFDENSWKNESGKFSVLSGAESILTTGTTASLLNLPAGIVGMRSAQLTAVSAKNLAPRAQSVLIGSTSGYTSGALVGGIEAYKDGKSLSESLSQINQAGLIGLGTGAAFMSTMKMDKSISLGDKYRTYEQTKTGIGTNGKNRLELSQAAEARRLSSIDSDLELALRVNSESIESKLSLPGKTKRFEVADDFKPKTDKPNPLQELEYHPRNDLNIPRLSSRLKDQGQTVEVVHQLPERLKGKQFDSYEDFSARLVAKPETFRVYKVEGHSAPLLVSEAQMPVFDRIRSLRSLAEKPIAYDNLHFNQKGTVLASGMSKDASGKTVFGGPTKEALMHFMSAGEAKESLAVLSARDALKKDPNARVALPEDIVVVMDELPNPSLVKKVIVHDREYYGDPWTRQSYDPEFQTGASANRDGEIAFYKPEVGLSPAEAGVNIDGSAVNRYSIRSLGKHEWSHLANFKDPHTDGLYKLAKAVDLDVPESQTAQTLEAKQSGKPAGDGTDKYYSSTYARKDIGEDWAVHMGEEFMSSEIADFHALAHGAPVRTTILVKNLVTNSVSGAKTHTNVFGRSLQKRMHYVETEVMPEAWAVLEHRALRGNPSERTAAVELLGHIGNNKKHGAILLGTAADKTSLRIKDSVSSLSEGQISYLDPAGRRTLADTAFDAAQRLATTGYGSETKLAFLLRQANSMDGQVKNLALNRLRQQTDGLDLVEFSQLKGDGKNMSRLMELMQGMSNKEGQGLVFDEIISLGSKGSYGDEFVTSVLVRTADKIPSQRLRAVTELGKIAVSDSFPGAESFFTRHSMSNDPAVADRANKVLTTLAKKAKVADTRDLLSDSSSKSRQEGLVMAVGMDDLSLVEPVLRIFATGSSQEAALAAQALKGHNPRVIKYYAQRLKSDGVDVTPAQIAQIQNTR